MTTRGKLYKNECSAGLGIKWTLMQAESNAMRESIFVQL